MEPKSILVWGLFFIIVWIDARGLARPSARILGTGGAPRWGQTNARLPAAYIRRWWTPKEYG